MRVLCPACCDKATVTHAETLSPVTRRAYCRCQNPECGWSGMALLTVMHTLSPSRLPSPAARLPIPNEARDALQLALQL